MLLFQSNFNDDTALAERYCNDQYSFCVRYSGSLLPHQQLLPDGSGIALQPYDRSALVTARADTTAFGQKPREYFGHYLETLSALEGPTVILDTLYGDDYYEALFTWQTQSVFHQAWFFDKHCVIMIVRTPANRPQLLKQIREEVRLEFGSR